MSTQPLIAGRYQIEAKVGDGGMGAVYRAVDTRNGKLVAVKQLRPDIVTSEPALIERFRREGEALRRLNHPNIVRVASIFNEGDAHYIVMEYVSGGTLQQMIKKRGALPVDRVLSIALELSDALSRAHHLNIVHRDIKSANVLIASDDTPRLSDFGIAHLGDRSRVTQARTVLGTLAYLSPEALNGDQLDTRSDIWSFGILIYEMLTGKLPFEEKSTSATIMSIFNKPLPSLQEQRSDIPPALIQLITQMLERDVSKRISSARLVGAELYALINGIPSGTQGVAPVGELSTGESIEISLVQGFIRELYTLLQGWEGLAQEAEAEVRRIQGTDRITAQYQRRMMRAYRDSAGDLRKLLESTNDSLTPPAEQQGYTDVPRQDVERLFEYARIKISNLYEDVGNIYTAVFPKLLSVPMEERIRKLKDLAPSLVVIESGRLETGEMYLDFAFETGL